MCVINILAKYALPSSINTCYRRSLAFSWRSFSSGSLPVSRLRLRRLPSRLRLRRLPSVLDMLRLWRMAPIAVLSPSKIDIVASWTFPVSVDSRDGSTTCFSDGELWRPSCAAPVACLSDCIIHILAIGASPIPINAGNRGSPPGTITSWSMYYHWRWLGHSAFVACSADRKIDIATMRACPRTINTCHRCRH
jgi:hypothetical protein